MVATKSKAPKERDAASMFASVVNEAFEVELNRDPVQPKVWLAYVDTMADKVKMAQQRYLVYER